MLHLPLPNALQMILETFAVQIDHDFEEPSLVDVKIV